MSLSIANPTMQDWTLQYRIGAPRSPEYAVLRQVSLPRGGRVELILGPAETAQMIEHIETHGGRPASEVRGSMHRLTGLLYSESRQISVEEVEAAHEAETQTREDRAVAQAVRAGLGFDKTARTPTQDRGPAQVTEVEVKQDVPRGKRRRGDEVDFSLTVTPEGRSDVKLPV